MTNNDRIFFVSQKLGHCGDNICCLSAAIEFAERIDGIVYVDFFKDVVEAYNHPRLRFGMYGEPLSVNAVNKHRNKFPCFFKNILGTYYAEFGLPLADPVLRLPKFPKGVSKALIQTESNFALNPPVDYIQLVVDEFIRLTGLEVFAVGGEKTERNLKRVNYDLLKNDMPFLMKQVQNAICVLTPRSLCANLAAGYKVPGFMWSPYDGEDWHLNYTGWDKVVSNWIPMDGTVLDPTGSEGKRCESLQVFEPVEESMRRFVGLVGFKKFSIRNAGEGKREQREIKYDRDMDKV